MSERLTCQKLIDFLVDYLEDRLDEDTKAHFEVHLDKCPPCKRYLDTYADAIRLGRKVCKDEDNAPPPVPDKLVAGVLDALKRNE